MTGFSVLFAERTALRQTGVPEPGHCGRVPLAGSDHPLLIRLQNFTKRATDGPHARKLLEIQQTRAKKAGTFVQLS